MAHLKKLIQFIKWRVKLHIHSALIWNGCLIFFITFWKIKFNRLDFGVGVFNAYFDLGIFSLKTKAHNVKFICDGHPINPPIFFQRINLFDIVSVTRWLYYCFNIWLFKTSTCKSRFKMLPNKITLYCMHLLRPTCQVDACRNSVLLNQCLICFWQIFDFFLIRIEYE